MSDVPTPRFRMLRGYAIDPSLSTALLTMQVNELVYKVAWETLEPRDETPGASYPAGEYLEIVDYDPATGRFYEPVNLDHPHLLAQDGYAPSVNNPQFHQQFVYAVIMTTIKNFEKALGRKILWAENIPATDIPKDKKKRAELEFGFVRRLRVYPHALRQANAFYDPYRKALLFGYFNAAPANPQLQLPGATVFTCLSHDIIAHETTHAILDGIHRRYIDATNPDTRAFHEAFADIVALFQHFSFPEVLRHQIAKTRGDLKRQSLLGELAQQFGKAIGGYGSLRDFLGDYDDDGNWKPRVPNPNSYATVMECHQRGALLVASVFDAFLNIYQSRIQKLMRIATGGAGVLPEGELHPDLVDEMASTAAKVAADVLRICIRALDYCPPMDLTFGDYLRALVTADYDHVAEDTYGYRVAFVEAFQKRGISGPNIRSMAVEDLLHPLEPVSSTETEKLARFLRDLKSSIGYLTDRQKLYETTKALIRGRSDKETQLLKGLLQNLRCSDDSEELCEAIETLIHDRSSQESKILTEVLENLRKSDDQRSEALREAIEKLIKPKRKESPQLEQLLQDLSSKSGCWSKDLGPQIQALNRAAEGLHALFESLFAKGGNERFVDLTGLKFPGDETATEAEGLEFAYLTSKTASYAIGNVSLANRVTPDDNIVNHIVVTLIQKRGVRFDVNGKDVTVDNKGFFVPDKTPPDKRGSNHIIFRGGCTLIFDLDAAQLRYAIKKDVDDRDRMIRQFKYEKGMLGDDDETYFDSKTLSALAGPFAFTHSHNA